MRRLLLLCALFSSFSFGAIVAPLPFTISSGQVISANPLQQNFNWLLNQVNANAAPLTSVGVVTSGSYTGTLTGCTTAPTVTITWLKSGNLVTQSIPSQSCTSNATTFTITGGPAAIGNTTAWTNSIGMAAAYVPLIDNTSAVTGAAGAYVNPDGTIILLKPTTAAWTNSGTKGIGWSALGTNLIGANITYIIH
jgi:hypothetical protein